MTKQESNELLEYINKKATKQNLVGNNSGLLAIVLDKEFKVDKFVFVENINHPHIVYHVAVEKDEIIYDSTGITTLDQLLQNAPKDVAKIFKLDASPGLYKHIIKSTIPTINFNDLD